MAQTVIGIFESSSKAQEAVQELIDAGITRDRIDVSSGNSTNSSYSSTDSTYSSTAVRHEDEHESGISRFFKNLFGDDDDDADKYTRVASRAQSILTVHAQSSDEAETIADILDDNGAVDVDEHASKLGYSKTGSYSGTTGTGVTNTDTSDYSSLATDTTTGLAGVTGSTGYTGTTGTTSNLDTTESGLRNDLTSDETKKIPIIEENIEVGKREVRTGGVRVRSRIVERPVEESVRLREERVNVERNTVDRPATSADLENFKERDIEMVERAEVPVVNKEARVVEEVSIGKEVEERKETIQDTVRKTEVDVENLEKEDLRTRDTNSNNL
ncbi:YsnF/AvaK domain-containing protein [Segetibacter koreensis]|uniref:YsnF/AvaK domain-containing protein n=1 Tax=Segetibacter koreensis TaxID=398037 RepID=UPI00036CD17D|nr:YsnF/AvaK domain-containing protein [Segetibacter koreensis]